MDAVPSAKVPPKAAGTVRVVSWNLQWFPGKSPKSTPKARIDQTNNVRAAMADLMPDILLAQEVQSETVVSLVLPPNGYRAATTSRFSGTQQLCIAGRIPADSAWFEAWKKDGKDDPPRGFAFASFRLPSGKLLMVYTVHLKSNAGGDPASNRAKREDAARQLIDHIRLETAKRKGPGELAVLVAGDFNTDPGQRQFEGERTLKMFEVAGFTWALASLSAMDRITWPAAEGFPDATFDHVLVKGIQVKSVVVPRTFGSCSDHRPVVVDLVDG
jgi:endonuclease/exonuclease/phosphatase family metal-dependent hydrolase